MNLSEQLKIETDLAVKALERKRNNFENETYLRVLNDVKAFIKSQLHIRALDGFSSYQFGFYNPSSGELTDWIGTIFENNDITTLGMESRTITGLMRDLEKYYKGEGFKVTFPEYKFRSTIYVFINLSWE